MYRNVYWHHAVRSATGMFKRAARDALRAGVVRADDVGQLTDDAMMDRLIGAPGGAIARAVRERRLYKRALDLPGSDVPDPAPWVSEDPDLVERVENALAAEAGVAAGELLLDFPSRGSMLSVDLPLRTRDGGVERLTDEGRAGHLGLPRVAGELYRSARRLRIFVARPVEPDLSAVARLVGWDAATVRRRLDSRTALLS